MSINSQDQSRFLTSPTEIRHAIYAHLIPNGIHLTVNGTSFRVTSFQISTCVRRNNDNEISAMQWSGKATPDGLQKPHPLHPRRLNSMWGEHWRCEEHAQKHGVNETSNLLLQVCKRMCVHLPPLCRTAHAIQGPST